MVPGTANPLLGTDHPMAWIRGDRINPPLKKRQTWHLEGEQPQEFERRKNLRMMVFHQVRKPSPNLQGHPPLARRSRVQVGQTYGTKIGKIHEFQVLARPVRT